MADADAARRLYDESIVIDGLNVSNWNSPAVFASLKNGGVTAHPEVEENPPALVHGPSGLGVVHCHDDNVADGAEVHQGPHVRGNGDNSQVGAEERLQPPTHGPDLQGAQV